MAVWREIEIASLLKDLGYDFELSTIKALTALANREGFAPKMVDKRMGVGIGTTPYTASKKAQMWIKNYAGFPTPITKKEAVLFMVDDLEEKLKTANLKLDDIPNKAKEIVFDYLYRMPGPYIPMLAEYAKDRNEEKLINSIKSKPITEKHFKGYDDKIMVGIKKRNEDVLKSLETAEKPVKKPTPEPPKPEWRPSYPARSISDYTKNKEITPTISEQVNQYRQPPTGMAGLLAMAQANANADPQNDIGWVYVDLVDPRVSPQKFMERLMSARRRGREYLPRDYEDVYTTREYGKPAQPFKPIEASESAQISPVPSEPPEDDVNTSELPEKPPRPFFESGLTNEELAQQEAADYLAGKPVEGLEEGSIYDAADNIEPRYGAAEMAQYREFGEYPEPAEKEKSGEIPHDSDMYILDKILRDWSR